MTAGATIAVAFSGPEVDRAVGRIGKASSCISTPAIGFRVAVHDRCRRRDGPAAGASSRSGRPSSRPADRGLPSPARPQARDSRRSLATRSTPVSPMTSRGIATRPSASVVKWIAAGPMRDLDRDPGAALPLRSTTRTWIGPASVFLRTAAGRGSGSSPRPAAASPIAAVAVKSGHQRASSRSSTLGS